MAFAVDCMLGKLARWLRIIGCDAVYFQHVEDSELVEFAAREGRLVLTRDTRLAAEAGKGRALLVESGRLDDQLAQVIRTCGIQVSRERFLNRCIVCNGELSSLDREAVRGRVPDYVFSTQAAFSGCARCGKIFWKSTHVEGMLRRLRGMGIDVR